MGVFNNIDTNSLNITVQVDAEDAIEQLEDVKEKVEEVGKKSEETEKKTKGTGLSFDFLSGALKGVAIASGAAVAATAAVGAALAALDAPLTQALKVEQLTTGFDALQKKVGADATNSLNALRESTKGLISDMDLMSSANQAVLLGVDDGTGKFAEMANAALKLGNAMGIDAKNALDSLVTGIGRGEKEILDNLGVVINAEDAYRRYAAQIGTTADKLTELGRKEAIKAIASQAVIDSAKGLTDVNDTAAEAYLRLSTQIKNTYDQIVIQLSKSEELKDFLNFLADNVPKLPALFSSWASTISSVTNKILEMSDVIAQAPILDFIEKSKEAWNLFGDLATRANNFANSLSTTKKAIEENIQPTKEQAMFLATMNSEALQSSDAFKGVKDALDKLDAPQKKVTANTEGFIKTTDKANKKLYEMIDIGKELSSKILERDLKQAVSELSDGFSKGVVSFETVNKVLGNLRNAFISLGLDVKTVDSVIKGVEWGKQLSQETDVVIDKLGFLGGIIKDFGGEGLAKELFSGLGKKSEEFAANLSLQIENGIASAITQAFESGDIGKSLKGLGTSIGQAVGTAIAGPIGGAIIGGVTDSTISGASKASKGQKLNATEQASLALATFGLSFAYNDIISSLNSKSASEKARKQVELFLEETLGKNVVFDKYTGKFDEVFSSVDESAKNAFDGIGKYLLDLLGITENVSGDIAAALGGTFGATIDDLKYVVDDLGITFEQVQDQMVNAFLVGDASAQEVITTLSSIEEAFKPGLDGVGQFTKAMDNLIGSMGMGRESLKSLKDLAVEFKETGGNSLAAFRAALESSGKYTAEQIQTLFQALSQRGINSLDDLANASDLTLIGIIADLQTLGFQFSEGLGTGIKDSIKDINELRDTITKLPDTVEKNLRINVSTNYKDSQSQQALNQLTAGSPGIPRA